MPAGSTPPRRPSQIALALEMDDGRSTAAELSVLQDRHRIGRDLHDNVMPRLFATGVGLQSLTPTLPADVARRLRRYIDDLDETIDQIRDRVFGLHAGANDARPSSRFPYVRGHASSD